jgi:sortase A
MMFEMFLREHGAQRRGAVACAVALAVSLVATSCGGSDGGGEALAATTVASSTTVAATTTTAAPATTTIATSTTTVAPATTTIASTSTSTTTTLAEQATQPIAPPSDPNAQEPVIEMGRLLIPKIGVDMTMYEGIRLTTLDHGPGHWPGSALPGEPGNVVVGGHRTSKHRVFRDVDDLVAGDEIVFRDAGGDHVYVVNRVEIVDPTAVWIINPTATPTATLFACHPPGSTRQRIVVFADLRV